jgi:ubiquinone biosynthesis protein
MIHAWHIVRRSVQMLRALLIGLWTFAGATWRQRALTPDALLRSLGCALVAACSSLGATFIKVGQIASTRADLLPRPLVEELTRLQDQVPPFPFEAVRRTIEHDFGRPLDEIFSRFEEQPLAAASVAQVHSATLRASGDRVAVKVRRPEILERVRLDRSILLFLARVAERLIPSMRLISFEDAMLNFCAAVEEQIHLLGEAANNRRFTAAFAGDPDIHFPRLYEELCSDAVLTMELIEGIRETELEGAGIDRLCIALAGLRCVCRMIFLHGFVHADLHPGNMRFRPPGEVILFDLGLVGTLVDEDRLSLAELMFAFATGDGVTVARLFHDNAPYKATPDYAAYEAEIVELVRALHRRGLGNLQVTLEIGRIFDILRRHHIRARSHMTMVNLALMTAEGLGKRLAPELSLTDESLPYLAEALGMAAPSIPGLGAAT